MESHIFCHCYSCLSQKLFLFNKPDQKYTFLKFCQEDTSLQNPNSPSFPCKSVMLQSTSAHGPFCYYAKSEELMGPVTTFPPFFTFWVSFTLIQHLPWLNSILLESWNYPLYSWKTTFMLCINVHTALHIQRVYLSFLWPCKLESKYKWGDCLAVSPKSMQSPSCLETLLVFCISSFTDESHFFSKFDSFSQIRVKPSTALQKMLDYMLFKKKEHGFFISVSPGPENNRNSINAGQMADSKCILSFQFIYFR